MLTSRALAHPKHFAHLDHFRENRAIAINEGLVESEDSYIYKPGMILVAMTSADENEGAYGSMFYPEDRDEAIQLLATGVWHHMPSIQVMKNQRRIYKFLVSVVYHITEYDGHRVPGEEAEFNWIPPRPDPDVLGTPDYIEQERNFMEYQKSKIRYRSMDEDLLDPVMAICQRQVEKFDAQLASLKENPASFYNYICDIREHSHHQTSYFPSRDQHSWVSHLRHRDPSCATPNRDSRDSVGALSLTNA